MVDDRGQRGGDQHGREATSAPRRAAKPTNNAAPQTPIAEAMHQKNAVEAGNAMGERDPELPASHCCGRQGRSACVNVMKS